MYNFVVIIIICNCVYFVVKKVDWKTITLYSFCRCILHNQARCESELESFQNEMAQYDAVLPVADMLAAQSDTVRF